MSVSEWSAATLIESLFQQICCGGCQDASLAPAVMPPGEGVPPESKTVMVSGGTTVTTTVATVKVSQGQCDHRLATLLTMRSCIAVKGADGSTTTTTTTQVHRQSAQAVCDFAGHV